MTTPPLSRRRSRTMPAKRSKNKALRQGYFVATGFWGFALGAGFMAIAFSLNHAELPRDGATLGLLAFGMVLSGIGGILASNSYRESRKR